jgi:hypothetical protein
VLQRGDHRKAATVQAWSMWSVEGALFGLADKGTGGV